MNITSEFPTWEILSSFGGAAAMVLAIAQKTKGMRFIKDIPTQVWTYILALLVLYPATYFTGGLTANLAVLTIFKAVGVSFAANGGFSAAKKFFGKPATVDGQLLIDSSNPEKDTYRFDVGSIDDLSAKKFITLSVHPGSDLSQ